MDEKKRKKLEKYIEETNFRFLNVNQDNSEQLERVNRLAKLFNCPDCKGDMDIFNVLDTGEFIFECLQCGLEGIITLNVREL